MKLHIERHGHGPHHLILLHGWAMHGGVFAPLIARLAPYCTLHVVDLPGHGHSRASEVALLPDACVDAIVQATPANALWCGWSLGGLMALRAAERGIARALVMLCASPRFVRGEDWPCGMSAEIFRDFAHGLRHDWHGTLERFIALEAFGSDHAKEELRHLRADLFARGEPAASVLADGLDLLENADLRPALPSLKVPSLWLAGRRDRLVSPQAMTAAAALAPKSRVHVIEQAGHAPFLTHADALAEHLLPWLHESTT